eukprot:TRINITY_DN87780_c0_g1_i1.p1 TRINITY_DN87780_c0_g1~~TRINITY_DN87780_c0_g1_i1.p1  ORF type:complete len:598 (-),score=80.77 TRINITY_DN87780_c0_g1_i1:310-2103(-)
MDAQETRRFVLTFRDAGTETAFALGRRDELVIGLHFLFWALFVSCFLGWFWIYLLVDVHEHNWRHSGFVGIIHGVSCLGIPATWRVKWWRRIHPNIIEGMSLALLFTMQVVLVCNDCNDSYYLERILTGLNPVWTYHSDSRILLALLGMNVAGHLLLSVRFIRLLSLDIFSNMIYTVAFLCYGSPEGTSNFFLNAALLAVATCITSIGHQKMERIERANFAGIRRTSADLIQERVLRVQTEFELDQRKRVDGGSTSRVQLDGSESNFSVAMTTDMSSLIAGGPSELLEARLQALREMGKRENWYISSSNLVVDWQNPLGRGGFGAVFQGKLHHSAVAAKVAATSLTRSLETGHHCQINALLNEIRLLRHLRHPNIVTFFGASVDESSLQVVVVEEQVKGKTLEEFVDQYSSTCQAGSWSERGLGRILLGICAGMAHLHDQEPVIIHGDLKPTNIMLSSDCCPKLVDFGLSRLLSKPRSFGHSRRWAAPEVFREQVSKSSSADVFSFGCIVFFVCTSKKPSDKQKKCKSNINLRWPSSPSDFQMQCKQICDVSVVLDPEDRSSTSDLLDMLARMAQESTAGFTPECTPPRSSPLQCSL